MSRENLEIVRRAYAAPAVLVDAPHVASDAEFDFSDVYPDQPVLRGMEAMRVFQGVGPWCGSIRLEPERDREAVPRSTSASRTSSRCAMG